MSSLPFALVDKPVAIQVPIIAGSIAFVCSLLVGPFFIRALRSRYTEQIKSDSTVLNELHASKKNTPTMGGVLIVLAFFIGGLAGGVISSSLFWITQFTAVALMLLGATDDWIKLRTSHKGLSPRQKLCGQILIAAVASTRLTMVRLFPATMDVQFVLTALALIAWSSFVIVATSNAVNLTDGLDGLATGCTILTASAMAFVFFFAADRASDTFVLQGSSLFAALAGACGGFLWFNRHPAKVFMGDAGALPIGGILAVVSLSSGFEFLLAICGLVFVAETASVIIQVIWFRRTKTRVFLCSPLHNHFVFKHIPEQRIVAAFWTASIIACFCGIGVWWFIKGP